MWELEGESGSPQRGQAPPDIVSHGLMSSLHSCYAGRHFVSFSRGQGQGFVLGSLRESQSEARGRTGSPGRGRDPPVNCRVSVICFGHSQLCLTGKAGLAGERIGRVLGDRG